MILYSKQYAVVNFLHIFEQTIKAFKIEIQPLKPQMLFLKTRPNTNLKNYNTFATGKNNFVKQFLAEDHLPRKTQCN